MDPIDQLPPDQSAVLSLLLRQGRSYAEIGRMLGIPPSAVRARAHAALDAISGGSDAEPDPRPATGHGHGHGGPSSRATGEAVRSGQRQNRISSSPARLPQSSRRAGALLLAAIAVVVVVAVVLIVNGSGGSSHSPTTGAGTTSAGATTGTGPQVDKQLTLSPANPSSSAVALVEIVSEGSRRAFLLSAEHLPPQTGGSFYAAWLYNSPSDAVALGRAPNVTAGGKLQAVGALPNNAASFHTMLLTRETSAHATRPGQIVLSGPFSVH